MIKKIIVLLGVVAVVGLSVKLVPAAPVGNPLKEPAKGELMIGYEETLVTDKDLKHNDLSQPHGYKSNQHLAKFSYGILEGLTGNGEIGVGRIKNVSLEIPHGNQLAWGGGFDWNIMRNLNSLWSKIPQTLPYDIEIGLSGRYLGIESDKDEQTPQRAPYAKYDENWKEFQSAAWLARDFGILSPYAALIVNWTQVRQKQEISGVITTRTLKDPTDVGYALGCDVSFGKDKNLSQVRFLKDINLSFEFRGASETALTAGINWVWKY